MSEDRRFYVYVHKYKIGHKADEIFYVGKGTGYRMSSIHNRNEWWRRIVKKYGFYSEILKDKLTDEESKIEEIKAISNLRDLGFTLCNATDGGDGSYGVKLSEYSKQKISESAKIRYENPRNHPRSDNSKYTWWNVEGDIFTGSVFDICEVFELSIGAMRRVSSGKMFSYKGWKRAGVRNYSERESVLSEKSDVVIYVLNKHGFPSFIGCRVDFCRFYNYKSKSLVSFFSGKTHSMDGWSKSIV